jgi:hypothetical protein
MLENVLFANRLFCYQYRKSFRTLHVINISTYSKHSHRNVHCIVLYASQSTVVNERQVSIVPCCKLHAGSDIHVHYSQ